MNRQRGQFLAYGALAAGVVIVGLSIALKLTTAHLSSLRAEYDGFKAQVKVLGEAAEKAKIAKEAADKATKERIDNETKTLRASNAAMAKRLRDYVAGSGGVSSLPATTGSPTLICFDRTLLDGAIQDYRRGFLGIAEKGAAAIADYSIALKWAREIR